MPHLTIHRLGQAHTGEIPPAANLVVRAGIKLWIERDLALEQPDEPLAPADRPAPATPGGARR